MLWYAFRFAPSAALAVLVCLITILWCLWLLRRSVYHTLDRFLLGFVGLLAVYQGFRLLKEVGLVTVLASRTVNNVVELVVAVLCLVAAVIMRLSNEQRRFSDFQIRSARAEPRPPLKVTSHRNSVARIQASAPTLEPGPIAELVPVLTDPAFKLYLYLYTRTEPTTGCATVDDEALTALRKGFDEISSLLRELEEQGVCQLQPKDPVSHSIVVQILSPWHEAGPVGLKTIASPLIALDRQTRESIIPAPGAPSHEEREIRFF